MSTSIPKVSLNISLSSLFRLDLVNLIRIGDQRLRHDPPRKDHLRLVGLCPIIDQFLGRNDFLSTSPSTSSKISICILRSPVLFWRS